MRISLWVRVSGQNSTRKLVLPILLNSEQLISKGFNLHEAILVTFPHVLQFCIYLVFLLVFHLSRWVCEHKCAYATYLNITEEPPDSKAFSRLVAGSARAKL